MVMWHILDDLHTIW